MTEGNEMTHAEIAANARKPYADKIKSMVAESDAMSKQIAARENEVRLLRALAKALGASQAALDETRYA